MLTIQRFLTKPHRCSYLDDQIARTEYEMVAQITAQEYQERLNEGWRKFGGALFRPQCTACSACQSIRILVDQFKPNRNQRRVTKANAKTELKIAVPSITREKIDLYVRHHDHHAVQKGWRRPNRFTVPMSMAQFIQAPIPVQEWQFYEGEKLLAIAYIDQIPDGFSGIYFYFDPDARELSPGTWIILSMLERAKSLGLKYVYLGYYVKNCRSMEYKGNFDPSEILRTDGAWIPFLP